MAQWMGQFTGNTHESKIKDIEETLLTAIEALKLADEKLFKQKQKSVTHLCERLLSARLKALSARISKLPKSQNLIKREKEMREKGINGIFVEFKIENLVKPD